MAETQSEGTMNVHAGYTNEEIMALALRRLAEEAARTDVGTLPRLPGLTVASNDQPIQRPTRDARWKREQAAARLGRTDYIRDVAAAVAYFTMQPPVERPERTAS
jgi:hypothetical protein